MEAARTLLTSAKLPLFLWTEVVSTACFTQNRSQIYKRFDKNPYELVHKISLDLKYLCVFGCPCYLLNDQDDLGMLKQKGDIDVFIGC